MLELLGVIDVNRNIGLLQGTTASVTLDLVRVRSFLSVLLDSLVVSHSFGDFGLVNIQIGRHLGRSQLKALLVAAQSKGLVHIEHGLDGTGVLYIDVLEHAGQVDFFKLLLRVRLAHDDLRVAQSRGVVGLRGHTVQSLFQLLF